ncbi:MAG: radical SAM protein [Nitrospirae bacterium]|nr:MAG: radical SAM protein [Nitrospirota bacterium]
MFDIAFYMKVNELKKRLACGEIKDKQIVSEAFEAVRNKKPVIYNIETTNACNMRCKMCPRTTMMTRPVETMSPELFRRIVEQIEPHSPELWNRWEAFVESEYGISKDAMSENHFFLHIIPRVIQLHGYGDPLLDRNMADYIALLNSKGFASYFSCNPSNINIEKTVKMFENGLDYIKYSIESVDDNVHKQIRGEASNFSHSYEKIVKLLDIKKARKYKTTIIITMLDLNSPNQLEEYANLRKAFEGLDVYIYLKSEDQQWYRKDFHGTCSIHWSEVCKHPWMSMTIKSNGEVAMCMEDFNNEIILGDARKESLYEIWNGEKYHQFRKDHIAAKKGMKCLERCDMKVVGQFLQ